MLLIYRTRKKVIVIENNVELIKEETKIIPYETTDIKSLIYTIRGRRYLLYVYIEQGISMLVGILRNEIAIERLVEKCYQK